MEEKFEYKSRTLYEITLRPYKQDSLDDLRFIKATSNLRNLLNDIGYLKYILMPEYSMPKYSFDRNIPNITYIHWHGIIYFEGNVELEQFLCTGFNRFSNNYHIQINPYRNEWKQYIKKQKDLVSKKFRLRNILSKELIQLKGHPLEDIKEGKALSAEEEKLK